MKLALSLCLFLISFNALATVDKKWGAFATYAPYDTWLFGKYGVTGSWMAQEDRAYELALQRSSLGLNFIIDDLAGIQENRIHLTMRSFTWKGSFNFQYGVYYNSLKVHLGKEYFDGVGAQYDVVELSTLGAMWGFGNRWSWNNGLSLGVDWFKIFYPVTRLKNKSSYIENAPDSSEKEDVKKLVDQVSKIPQFSFIHLEIGYRF